METLAVRAQVIPRLIDLFFVTIALWLRAGVSLIAEHYLDNRRHKEPIRDLNRSADETRMASCVRHVVLTWASV